MDNYEIQLENEQIDEPESKISIPIFIDKIKNMMINIMEKNRISEKTKKELYNNMSFDMNKLFNELDTDLKDQIKYENFDEYLKKNNKECENEILSLFIRQFSKIDNVKHSYLVLKELAKCILPWNDAENENFENNIIDDNNENIGEENEEDQAELKEVNEKFLNILEKEFELIKGMISAIEDIKKSLNFSTYEAFTIISKGKKFLNLENLKLFIGKGFSDSEIEQLIYRIDLINDKKITYDEFQDIFFPSQPHLSHDEIDRSGLTNLTNEDIKIKSNYFEKIVPEIIKEDGKILENVDPQIGYDPNDSNDSFSEPGVPITDKKSNEDENEEKNEKEYEFEEYSEKENNINKKEKEDNQNEEDINLINKNSFENNKMNRNKIKENAETMNNNQNENSPNYLKNDKIEINDELNDSEVKEKLYTENPKLKNDSYKKKQKEVEEMTSKSLTPEFNSFKGDMNQFCLNSFPGNPNNYNENEKDLYISATNLNMNNTFKNNSNNIINNDTLMTINQLKYMTSRELSEAENEYSLKNNALSFKGNNIKNEENNENEDILQKARANFNEVEEMTANQFIEFIHELVLLENKTESLKESLVLCNDLTLLEIFLLFDNSQRNTVSKEDFKEVCKKYLFLFPTFEQINLVFNRYDLDKDQNLNKNEFLNMLKPLKEEYVTILDEKEKVSKINQNLSFKSKKVIIDLMKSIIFNESCIYELRARLLSRRNFSCRNIWKLLMKYSTENDLLKREELKYFLESFGSFLTQYELDILFNKYSKDGSAITYEQFYKEMVN